jgi:hypothetical protein
MGDENFAASAVAVAVAPTMEDFWRGSDCCFEATISL